MVDSIDHRLNKSANGETAPGDDWMWFVEPSQDGAIYVFTNEGNGGMQKLGLTVKQLFERSPHFSTNPPVKYEVRCPCCIITSGFSDATVPIRYTSQGFSVGCDSHTYLERLFSSRISVN